MNIDIPVIPSGILTLLSLFAPYAIALVNRKSWPKGAKKAVSITVPIILAGLVIVFYYFATGDGIPAWPTLVLLAVVTTQASYALVTKPSAKVLEAKTSPSDKA